MTCYRCAKKRQRKGMCAKHRLMHQMRKTAALCDKSVPTWHELEKLQRPNCRLCAFPMVYEKQNHERKGSTASLQHWPDGTHEIICTACNTQHAANQKRKHPRNYADGQWPGAYAKDDLRTLMEDAQDQLRTYHK